jgi:hypothetical protein
MQEFEVLFRNSLKHGVGKGLKTTILYNVVRYSEMDLIQKVRIRMETKRCRGPKTSDRRWRCLIQLLCTGMGLYVQNNKLWKEVPICPKMRRRRSLLGITS